LTGITGYGLRIAERVPITTQPTLENAAYLMTKQMRLGHALDLAVQTAAH
jgi:3,4-dihydroxy 2-butanone 4-phosphate synthase/GTP cyclohydrolase II